ncbi:hypothetical protein DSO57_1000340 [Entomophthora muscae]|uniref:Uncharacterized protein n=1 Tax=Entomophthora muscae TaxID=34485 RepID=A0ACC2TKP4_9FUNG|nr:hypothetical protein DSO57_1000340 [Entomophthora muscae]
MHLVVGLLQYILYNLILNRIISGRWGPAVRTLLLVPPNVNFTPANLEAPPPILETENCVASQCPEFYSEDTLMLSQAIYLGLLWLGLIVLLNPDLHGCAPNTINFDEPGPFLDFYNGLPTYIRRQFDMTCCKNLEDVFLEGKHTAQKSDNLHATNKRKESSTARKDPQANKQNN